MIEVENASAYAIDTQRLEDQAAFMFAQLRLHPDTDVSILLVDEPRMEELHIEWMDEPGATDVLSFPMDELTAPLPGEAAPEGMLGDIVLCPAFAERQALVAGSNLVDELALLLTHGILHCLGHDHLEPEEHALMFGLQAQLLDAWKAAHD